MLISKRARLVLALASTAGIAAPGHFVRPVAASPSDSDPDDAPDVAPTKAPQPSVARRPAGKVKSVAFDPTWLQPFFAAPALRKAASQYRLEQWAAAETGFLKAASRLPAKSDERQAARYLAALAKAYQAKWSDAAALFESLFKDYPRLLPYHAYQAARCRLRAGQPQAALDWADKVPDGTVPDAESELVRLDALRALGRWKHAATAASKFLTRFPGGPRRAEAMFKQADALEKAAAETPTPEGDADLADITALYRRVWADAPLDEWGNRAGDRLDAIAATLPPAEATLVRTHVAGEWVTRAMVYFDRNRNSESEAAFASALAAPGLDADLECRARYHKAQSAWKQRQRPRAAPLFDEAEAACGRAHNTDLHAKALYQGARSWAAAGDRAAAQKRYGRVEAEHAEHSYADDARVRTAELASDSDDEETANKLLAEVPALYPKGDLLGEALWRLAFSAWRAEKYDDALRWLDENLRRIPHEEIWYAEGRALYWKARVLERRSDSVGARDFYQRAVREYPLSVYALLALARLDPQANSPPGKPGKTGKPDQNAKDPTKDSAKDPKDPKDPRDPKEAKTAKAARAALLRELRDSGKPTGFRFTARPLFGEPGFRRAVDLARMGQGSDARRELAKMGLQTAGDKKAGGAARRDEEDLLWIAAVLLDRAGLWNAAHSIPRYTLTDYRLAYPRGLGATKWRLSYPRAFPELVTKNARANQIPEALQLAIMREESAFSPRIESFANAIGLTQMLIKTAKRFSNRADVKRDDLQDPAKNLEYGSRFLAFLWNRFGKAAPLTIAGYNAGEGAVDKWLGERGQLAMDEFMESIPYDETRNYTKRVLASYFAYSWLYDDKHPVPSVPSNARSR